MGYILIAEDDVSSQDVIRIVMLMEGYECLFVTNGAEALAAIAKDPPSLILLDLQMPVMDGQTFLKIYCNTDGPHAPVIVVSAFPGTFDRQANCVSDFLRKPYELDTLLESITKYMGQDAQM